MEVAKDQLVLARFNATPFNAAHVEILTLVELLDGQSEVRVDLDAGTAEVSATASINRVWELPVEHMNRLLPHHNPTTEPAIRNVLISLDALTDYQVL